MYAARRFASDQSLQMELIDDERLDNLGLNDRRGNLDDRFVFEENPPLRNGPNVAREMKIGEIV